VQTGWNESVRERSSPFALRAKYISPSHAEEPNGTLSSDRRNAIKTAQSSPRGLFTVCFGPVLLVFLKRSPHIFIRITDMQTGWYESLRERSRQFEFRAQTLIRYTSKSPMGYIAFGQG
jgi:hypothetical protein